MKINRVKLVNIKSYTERSPGISFPEGTIAIIGPNGSGKSTLFEAIGYSLYDYLPYGKMKLLRTGEEKGEIRVQFTGEDEKNYEVTRNIPGTISLYDLDEDTPVAAGRGAVMDKLRWLTGLPPDMNPGILYSDAIGIPQGFITVPFMEKPSIRKNIFDPLLGVDIYRTVFANTSSLAGHIQDKISSIKEDKKSKEGKIAPLPQKESKLQQLRKELRELGKLITREQMKVGKLGTKLGTYDRLEREIAILGGKVKQFGARVEGLESELERAKNDYLASKEARYRLKVLKPLFVQHGKIERLLRRLRKDERKKHRFENWKVDLQGRISRLKTIIAERTSTLGGIAEAEGTIKEIRPMVKKQRELEAKIRQLHNKLAEFKKSASKVPKFKERLQRAQYAVDTIQRKLERKKDLCQEVAKKRGVESHKRSLESEFSSLKGKQEKMRAYLKDAIGGKCPILREPCPLPIGMRLDEYLRKEIRGIESKCFDLGSQVKKIEQLLSRIHHAEKELQKLKIEEGRLGLLKQQASGYRRDLRQAERYKQKATETIATVSELNEKLKQLGDPESKYIALHERIKGKSRCTRELSVANRKLEQTKQRLTNVEGRLSKYIGIENQLHQREEKLRELKPSYEGYLSKQREAEKLRKRMEDVKKLKGKLIKNKRLLKASRDKARQLERKYDAKKHFQVRADHQRLSNELAASKREFSIKQGDTQTLRKEVDELREIKAEIVQLKKRIKQLETVLKISQAIRGILQKADEEVTKILVRNISQEANRIWRDLTALVGKDLEWTETYEILVGDGKEKLIFHQLSGGEQMCAALAVRLALLRELVGSDIAIFDEPTYSLDDSWRTNLADLLPKISKQGFVQLFVISHDDTFDRDADFAVRLGKENEETILAEE